MTIVLDEQRLKELAAELAKDINSEKYLGALSSRILKLAVEAALGAEIEEYFGYSKLRS